MRLTDITIRKLKLPESGQKIFFDDTLPGFGIRLSKRLKSFVVYYGTGANRRFKTLGRYPELSLQNARREAKILLAVQSKSIGSTSYSGTVLKFLADCETRNRPETIRQYRGYLQAFTTRKNLGEITRSDILKHLSRYRNQDAAYAHALASLKVFYNWCIRHEFVDHSPVAGERKHPVAPRERVLTFPELKQIYEYDFPKFSTVLKLCILTGQRRNEIASMYPVKRFGTVWS